jgi:hypothetical protein
MEALALVYEKVPGVSTAPARDCDGRAGRRQPKQVRGRTGEDYGRGAAGDGGSCKVTKMNRAASAPEEIRRERAQLERYWLAEMERLGAELVHARHADRRPVTDQPPHLETHFVEAWLKKKAHAAKVRAAWLYAIPLAVSIIAAVAACIAAWPVLKEWLAR